MIEIICTSDRTQAAIEALLLSNDGPSEQILVRRIVRLEIA